MRSHGAPLLVLVLLGAASVVISRCFGSVATPQANTGSPGSDGATFVGLARQRPLRPAPRRCGAGRCLRQLQVAATADGPPSEADAATEAKPKRSWRQAHEAAKAFQVELDRIISTGNTRVSELDGLFLTPEEQKAQMKAEAQARVDTGQKAEPEKEESKSLFGIGDALQLTPEERVEGAKDGPEAIPLLAGNFSTGQFAIIGMYSDSPELQVGRRVTAVELLDGAGDDPELSSEENALWKQSAELLAETLGPKWPQAEAVAAAVKAAEERAESRRGPRVFDFRDRVLTQMDYAFDYRIRRDRLEEFLTTLQTDSRLFRYLKMLEDACVEAEKLQAQLEEMQSSGEANARGYRGEMAEEKMNDVYYKARSQDSKIRACVRAAIDLPETLDAYDKLGEAVSGFGDALKNLNPFR